MKKRLKLLFLLLLGGILFGISFWFSSMEAYDSRLISMRAAIFLRNHLFPQQSLVILHGLVRQWAHVLVFFLFTLILCLILDCLKHKKILLPFGMAFCFVYARFDEWKKVFFPSRHDDFQDVVRNWKGAAAGIAVFLFIKLVQAIIRRLARLIQKSRH